MLMSFTCTKQWWPSIKGAVWPIRHEEALLFFLRNHQWIKCSKFPYLKRSAPAFHTNMAVGKKRKRKKAESSLGMLWLYPQWCFTEKCLYMQIEADGGKQRLRLFQGIKVRCCKSSRLSSEECFQRWNIFLNTHISCHTGFSTTSIPLQNKD